jgi:hypothetical protein
MSRRAFCFSAMQRAYAAAQSRAKREHALTKIQYHRALERLGRTCNGTFHHGMYRLWRAAGAGAG